MKVGESMLYISEKSKALTELEKVIKKQKDIKIKAIFTLGSPSWSNHHKYRTYMQDTEVYILFENNKCLVIDYVFVDSFGFEFREFTEEEMDIYRNEKMQDYFNATCDICDHRTYEVIRNETCSLTYSSIDKVEIRSVTKEYEKWLDDDIDFVEPTSETFDQIKFIMDNGKSFVICAEDASVDGYVNFWSEDSTECVTEFEVEK